MNRAPSEIRQITEFPAYYVDDQGNVYSSYIRTFGHSVFKCPPLRLKRIKGIKQGTGYLHYALSKDGCKFPRSGHRLVCEAFHGRPPSDKALALHINDIGTDNRASNLLWGSVKQNALQASGNNRLRRGVQNNMAKLNAAKVRAIRSLLERGVTTYECAKQFGIDPSTVAAVGHRKTWRHVH